MTTNSVSAPFPIFTDTDGDPLDLGYVYIGQPNLDAQTSPKSAYWDAALTILAAQPIRTRGGYPVNNGTPARIYVDGDYSIKVNNRNGTLIYNAPTRTNRIDASSVAGISSDMVAYTPAGTGAVATTVQSKLQETVSVFDFMTAAQIADVKARTGSINVAAAIQAAVNSLSASGGVVYFPPGVYLVSSTIAITGKSNVVLKGIGYSGSWTSSTLGSSIKISSSLVDGFDFTSHSYNCTVQGLHIFGGKRAVHFDTCLGWHVIECNLRQNVTGLECYGNGVGIVRDCMIRDNTTSGIYLAASSGDTVITGCDIGGNGINVICATGNTHITDNAIFSSKNSGNGCGILVDATQASADSTIRNCVISGNLIANNDRQIVVKGTSLANTNVQDVWIHSNHIHQADDGGEGFDSSFAYGQGVFIQFAKRVHIHHNNIIGCRDYGIKAVSCVTGVFIDHNYVRNGNAAGVIFDLVQWGRIDNNEFTSNAGTAIQMNCTAVGDYNQNNRIHGNAFQFNGAIYTENTNTRANFIHDNLGGTLGDYSLSTTAPISQLRHPVQGGNQQSWKNQTLYVDGAAWDGPRLALGSYNFWVDGIGRLRIKSGSPTSDTDGTVVGTQT